MHATHAFPHAPFEAVADAMATSACMTMKWTWTALRKVVIADRVCRSRMMIPNGAAPSL